MNSSEIQDKIENTLKETTEHLTERVRPHLAEGKRRIESLNTQSIRPHLAEGKRRIESLNTQARALINDHPAVCLLGAVALGYLVARLARRERS